MAVLINPPLIASPVFARRLPRGSWR
jgi:hypothetical protein